MNMTLQEALTPDPKGRTPLELTIVNGGIHTLPKEWLTATTLLKQINSNNETFVHCAITAQTLNKIPLEVLKEETLTSHGITVSDICESAALHHCFHQLPEQYKNNIETLKHKQTLNFLAFNNPGEIKPEWISELYKFYELDIFQVEKTTFLHEAFRGRNPQNLQPSAFTSTYLNTKNSHKYSALDQWEDRCANQWGGLEISLKKLIAVTARIPPELITSKHPNIQKIYKKVKDLDQVRNQLNDTLKPLQQLNPE